MGGRDSQLVSELGGGDLTTKKMRMRMMILIIMGDDRQTPSIIHIERLRRRRRWSSGIWGAPTNQESQNFEEMLLPYY